MFDAVIIKQNGAYIYGCLDSTLGVQRQLLESDGTYRELMDSMVGGNDVAPTAVPSNGV